MEAATTALTCAAGVQLVTCRHGDAAALAEEPRLLEFERNHNLATGWKGMGLPSLTWLRTGRVVWLSPENGAPIRASFAECRDALARLADSLASAFRDSTNPRVVAAVRAWLNRAHHVRDRFLELATGLSAVDLQQLQAGAEPFAFWEMRADSNWEAGAFEPSELLAAARMSAGVVDLATIQSLLVSIRGFKKHSSAALDALSARAVIHVSRKASKYAFESGYAVADFLKSAIPEAGRKFVDVEALLRGLGVEVVELNFRTDRIDAVAVWGARGPAIALNFSRAYSTDTKRTRITLAHELCHMLVDRNGGLPFCDVLGGKVDDYVERRAKAFAAELLLPRQSVEHEWSMWRAGTFSDFQHSLSQVYGVSKTVICAQVHNSSVFGRLDRVARDYVFHRLREFDGWKPDPIVPIGTV